MEWNFGWLPLHLALTGSDWAIETLNDYASAMAAVRSSRYADDEWIWPPISSSVPQKPAERFTLPVTHKLIVQGSDVIEGEDLTSFVVALLGFLFGCELLPDGWGHLNRVCVQPGRWPDFWPTDEAVTRVVERGMRFYRNEHVLASRFFFGLLRWHQVSIAYDHPHEVFAGQYMVLDACWKIHVERGGKAASTHGDRITVLATEYGLDRPSHWQIELGTRSPFLTIRNELVHEARWCGMPIGTGGSPPPPNDAPHLDLFWFNSRLILALLGERGGYVNSRIVGQTYRLE